MMLLNKAFVAGTAAVLILGLACAGQAEEKARPAPIQVAQGFGLPPADVGGRDAPRSPGGQDEASLLIRIERLESQVRQLNGQLEQMQFENHKLEDQLRKFQQDVDFRFQENGGRGKPQRRSEAEPLPQTDSTLPASDLASRDPGSATTPPSVASRSGRRNDAFDPAADPNAPGAPRPLGSAASAAPPPVSAEPGRIIDEGDGSAPLELSSSPDRIPRSATSDARPGGAQAPGQATPNPAAAMTTPGGTVIANVSPNAAPINSPKEEFDLAMGYMKQKEYDAAEKSFSAFLQKNPKTRYTAEAIYYLGETYYQRGRQREAAEQYLKISSNYANSARAPEALLRLGQSLHALGAKEQACASFSEVPRKYPNASASVKAAAEREAKRLQC